MKGKKVVKRKKGHFFVWAHFLTRFNSTECLFISWLLWKAKQMNTYLENKMEGCLDKNKMEWTEADNGWVRWNTNCVLNDLTFLNEKNLSKIVQKFNKLNILSWQTFVIENKTLRKIRQKHVRINLSELHKYLTDKTLSKIKEFEQDKHTRIRYTLYINDVILEDYTYFPVDYSIIDALKNSKEILLYHWIKNELKVKKIHKFDKMFPVKYIKNALGFKVTTQRKLLKSIREKGLLNYNVNKKPTVTSDGIKFQSKRIIELKTKNSPKGSPYNSPKGSPYNSPKGSPYKLLQTNNKNSPVSCGNTEGGQSWIIYVKKKKTGITPPVTFFTPPAKQIEDDYHRLAIKLKDIVKKNKARYKQISTKKWAKELRLLGKSLRDETPEPISHIEKTIDWYEKNYQKQFTPKADSASAFREKYGRIRRQMEKTVHDDIKITPQALSYTDQLLRYQWPELAKGQLPKIVQQGINVVNTFRKLVYDFVREATQVDKFGWPDAKDKLRFFAKDKILTHVNIENVVIEKLKRVWERNINNPNWDGDLTWNAITKNDILECPLQYQPLWKDVLSRINYL